MCATLLVLLFSLSCTVISNNGALGGFIVDQEEDECTCKNSYLWKVDANPPIYLYGTLHVPYTKLWNRIPANQKTAFSSSSSLMTELKLTDPTTQKRLSECQFLPGDENLQTILPIDLYQRVEKYFERIRELFLVWLKKNSQGGLNFFLQQTRDKIYQGVTHNWQKRRPIWLLFLIDSLTENMIQYRSTPVFDTFLGNAANGLDKKTEAIENVADHCRPLNNLNQDQVIMALRKKLDYLEPLALRENGPPSSEDKHVKTYFCGDFEKLVQTTDILPLPKGSLNMTTAEAQAINSMNAYLKKQIIFRRNRKMTRAIMKMLENENRNETAFFAVGAGHFLGRKSIVDLLQKKNYTVERVSIEKHIDGPGLPRDIVALGDPSSVHKILNIPREIVTEAPPLQTLPPLTKEEISDIVNAIINSSKTYRIDSVEVNVTVPAPSSSPSSNLTSSPITPEAQAQTTQQSQPSYIKTTSGMVIALEEEELMEEPNSANTVRWRNNLGTLLLAIISIAFSRLLLL